MKFIQIKRTKCQRCKWFVSCVITNKIAVCNKCDPNGFAAASEAQKEAWLKGEF